MPTRLSVVTKYIYAQVTMLRDLLVIFKLTFYSIPTHKYQINHLSAGTDILLMRSNILPGNIYYRLSHVNSAIV